MNNCYPFTHTANIQQTTLKKYELKYGNYPLMKEDLKRLVENIVINVKNAQYERLFLSAKCFQNVYIADASTCVYMRERFKLTMMADKA